MHDKFRIVLSSCAVQLAMLVGAVLVVYLPSLFAEYSVIDDVNAIAGLADIKEFTIRGLFFPKGTGGYYRPILAISQQIDKFVWNLSSPIAHAENILLHTINSVWIFLLTRHALAEDRRLSSTVPLIAALIFALHPVMTESVNWYSGRTDLLAGFFGYPALYALLVWKDHKKGVALPLLAVFCAVLGLLSKEAVLGLLLAIPLLIIPTRTTDSSSLLEDWKIILPLFAASFLIGLYGFIFWPSLLFATICLIFLFRIKIQSCSVKSVTRLSKLFQIVSWIVISGGTVIFFSFGIRKIVFSNQMPIFGQTVVHIVQDPEYAIGQFIGAIAFYVKKLFVPVPLNFAIREIDPMYQLAGIALLFLTVIMIVKRDQASLFFLAGIVTIAPSLPFVFGIIAWTSFAERYMYLSVGLWAVSIGLFVDFARFRRVAIFSAVVALLLFSIISFKRNTLWQSNLELIADTVEKSPNFKTIRGIYLTLLFENGNYEEAAKQYEIASKLPQVGYSPEYDLAYAQILYKLGKIDKAREMLDIVDRKTKKHSEKVRQIRSSLNL